MDQVMSEELAEVLLKVLNLETGETFALREPHIFASTVHRYDDGWTVLLDVPDRHPCPRAMIGWYFRHYEDMTDFIAGQLGPDISKFALQGSCG
jgi:hypothetical protein